MRGEIARMNSKHYIGKRISSLELYDEIGPITGVAMILDDENEIFSGDESGYVLETECPYATQEIADAIFAKVSGGVYRGYRASGAQLPVTAELGDGVTVDTAYSVLAYQRLNFGPGHLSEIAAPGENVVDHEYPYLSPSERKNRRERSETRATIEKNSEEILLKVENEVERLESSIETTLEGITLSVKNNADGTSSYFELKSGDAVLSSGNITFDGFVTFYGLAGGTTTINGDCIKTGTILADLIKAGVLQSKDGETFKLDLDNGTFSMCGSGRFQSPDGKTYVEVDGDELVMYSLNEDTEVYDDKIRLGFMNGTDPNGEGRVDYPHILLGNSDGAVGMVKKFYNGLWVGNSIPRYASGNFEGMVGAAGFFIDTRTGKSYVVNGTEMRNVSTSGTGTDENGYMLASAYDSDGSVAKAGGIAAYLVSYIDEALKGSY